MDILKILLEITIYSAVLFAAIMLFKKAAKGKISPVLSFVLWFLLLARLCVPVTLQSGYHLITLPQVQQQNAAGEIAPDANTAQRQIPAAADQNTPVIQGTGMRQTPADTGRTLDMEPAKALFSFDIYDVLIIIWLGGAALIAAWTIYIAARVSNVAHRKSAPAPPGIEKIYSACKEEMGIKKKLPLLITQDLASPALLVSFRPKILLPLSFVKEAPDAQIELALRHELTHYRRMDHLICMLIDVLSAVYWFNPVIWLAEKEILSDMETACDNRIVRNMKIEEKSHYANTILSMLSKKAELPFALGMALTNTKRVAEKRIRGIYMKDKSKKSVKTAALLLVLTLLAACFTTACQPVRVQETELAAAFDAAPSPEPSAEAAPQESLQPSAAAEERFAENKNLSDIVTVNYDAAVVRPQGNIPVASMEIRDITEEDVQKVADYFFAGRQAYDPWERTKTELQADIDALEQENSKIAANKKQFIAAHPWAETFNQSNQENDGNMAPAYNMKEDYKVSEEDWNAYTNACSSADTQTTVNNYYIEKFKAELESAPDTADKQPATLEFRDVNQGPSVMASDEKLSVGDQDSFVNMAIIWAENSDGTISEIHGYGNNDGINSSIQYCRQLENGKFSGVLFGLNHREQLTMPQEQAQKLAEDAVRAICPEMPLAGAKVFRYYDNTGANMVDGYYMFTFVRNVGNVPITYDSWGGGNYYSNEANESFGYEQIQVYVDNKGIVSMVWQNPYANIQVTDENAQTISLEAARESFEKNLLEQLKNPKNVSSSMNADSITLDIKKIQLGLTRVMDEDGNFTLVPTWDFFGEAHATKDGEEQIFNRFGQTQGNDSLGTVNALDGTEIIRKGDSADW